MINKLKAWRLERGLTQLSLSDFAKVPRSVIQHLEAGGNTCREVYKKALSRALHVSMSKLFPNSNSRNGVSHE